MERRRDWRCREFVSPGRAVTDEGELIKLAKRGDVDAYGELVRRHQRDARRVAAAICGHGAADDVAQEAFVRAYRALGRFRDNAPFRPWLLAIVANLARNQRRSEARHERLTQRSVAGRVSVVAVPSAEDAALADSRREQLRREVDALPPKWRDVVTCRYVLDLSEHDTAIVLGVAAGTVKSRLSRALERLEQHLIAAQRHG